MATINLGNIKFTWQGAYDANTAYAIDDVVSYNGSSYVCIQASTGNLPTVTTHWNVMSLAGTNGTDLTTTLTTQGDILYRDGSGLQRLPKGTANQELRINSGATAPEWFTPAVVSSDYSRLASGTFSTSASELSVDNYFTSDYDIYKFYFETANTAGSGNNMRFIWRQGGANKTDSEYVVAGHYNGINTSNNNTGAFNNLNGYNPSYHHVVHFGNTNSDISSGEITMFSPLSTDRFKTVYAECWGKDGSSQWVNWHTKSIFRLNTTAMSGFRLYTGHGSNFSLAGKWNLYGMKNS